MSALENLGFTTFLADNIPTTLKLYEAFPHNTLAVLMSDSQIASCSPPSSNSSLKPTICIKSKHHRKTGIPLWKIFSFDAESTHPHPLGPAWTLSPEPPNSSDGRSGSTAAYLGYGVESTCSRHAFIEPALRPLSLSGPYPPYLTSSEEDAGRPQACILAKHISHFSPSPLRAWPAHFYTRLGEEGGVRLVTSAGTNGDRILTLGEGVPKGISTLGPGLRVRAEGVREGGSLNHEELMEVLRRSSVLIGIGKHFSCVFPLFHINILAKKEDSDWLGLGLEQIPDALCRALLGRPVR